MNTYEYHLITDRYEVQGHVDAEDEEKADALIRHQVDNPRNRLLKDNPATVKSIKLNLKKSA